MSLKINSFLVSGGAVIRSIIIFISMPVMIRLLGIEQYGIWTVINAQIGLFSLAELGITTALQYRLAQNNLEKNKSQFYDSLGTSIILLSFFGILSWAVFWSFIPQSANSFSTNLPKEILFESLKYSSFIVIIK